MNKIQTIAFALLLLGSCNEKPKEYTLAIGTYTQKEGHVDGKADGIYLISQNIETGRLMLRDTIKGVTNPSYLIVHPDHKTIYAVNEIANKAPENIGTVSSFKPDQSSGTFKLVNRVLSKGDAPCHISLDASGQFVIISNYMGSVSTMKINKDYGLSAAIDVKIHEGGDTLSLRQSAPHPHMSHVAPDGQTVLVSDLGTNSIWHYKIDTNGHLDLQGKTQSTPNAGPRHMSVHTTHDIIYVLNELNNTIEVFEWKNGQAPMKSLQVISTIRDTDRADDINSAAIRLHPNGKFLYACNRNANDITQNTISVYQIDKASALLSLLEIEPTNGDTPRDFIIDPQGKFLLVAHQNSDNIKTYKIQEDGTIEDTQMSLDISTPVCLSYF